MTDNAIFFTSLHVQGLALKLETRWIAPERSDAPLIVFLHEGLGSISMWGDWPEQLCAATGCRGLMYSRYGYGHSTPRPAGDDWPVDYMHVEARQILPALFEALRIDTIRDRPVLFGHSDGGSISLLYAAAFPYRVAGIVVVAPHSYIEDIGLVRIRQVRDNYGATLRDRLGPHHADADAVFKGWSDLWLSPALKQWDITEDLPKIVCPVLAVQGEQDQYATLNQLDDIVHAVPQTELLILENCRHSPHQDQPQALLEGTAGFLRSLQKKDQQPNNP